MEESDNSGNQGTGIGAIEYSGTESRNSGLRDSRNRRIDESRHPEIEERMGRGIEDSRNPEMGESGNRVAAEDRDRGNEESGKRGIGESTYPEFEKWGELRRLDEFRRATFPV